MNEWMEILEMEHRPSERTSECVRGVSKPIIYHHHRKGIILLSSSLHPRHRMYSLYVDPLMLIPSLNSASPLPKCSVPPANADLFNRSSHISAFSCSLFFSALLLAFESSIRNLTGDGTGLSLLPPLPKFTGAIMPMSLGGRSVAAERGVRDIDAGVVGAEEDAADGEECVLPVPLAGMRTAGRGIRDGEVPAPVDGARGRGLC